MSFDRLGSSQGRAELEGQHDAVYFVDPAAINLHEPEGPRLITHTESALYGGTALQIAEEVEQLTPVIPIHELTKLHESVFSAERDRSNEVFRLSRNPETYEVAVESDLTLDDWESITPPEDWAVMMDYVHDLKSELAKRPENKRSVVFINPTMEGGGVAMMRPPLVHMLRLLDIDARWYVMEGPKPGEPNVFEFTKQMHNTIQDRLPADVRITEEGKALHQKWALRDNGAVLQEQEPIQNAAIVNLDDPQPGPLARKIKSINPGVKLVWRNHIHNFADKMMDPSTPQGEVHQYLQVECGLRDLVDVAIYHPDINNNFVPEDNYDKTVLAPAVIEAHDDMNRELTEVEKEIGIGDINAQILANNEVARSEGRIDDTQELLDPDRDRIILIARFDESKGMDKAMAMGALIRERVLERRAAAGLPDKEPPQIVIIGNGSKDDPSGKKMLEEMMRLRREDFGFMKDDIIVQRLLHNYVAINASMYNDNPEATLIAMQMSDAEGCETRISDWINHGIPVIVAGIGGMPLQVREGESGIILDYNKPGYDLERGAEFATSLIFNQSAYQAMRASTFKASRELNKREYSTTANVMRLSYAFRVALTAEKPDKFWRIDDRRKARSVPLAA